jgi:hypothetical protein
MRMNRLPVNKRFQENVRGTLQAKFRCDDPEACTEDDGGGKRYIIDLFFVPDSGSAGKIEDVIFYLDDAYIDRVRLGQKNRDGSFEAVIESSGDFVITVEVLKDGKSYTQQMWLADMLEAGYADTIPSRPIQDAIRNIREN